MRMNSDSVLRELADRQAIADLIYRYCRAVDRLDVALGHSIWHDGGVADYGPDVYQGEGRGVIDLICRQHRHTLHHSHQVTNIIIEIDGDHAGSESYAIAALRMKMGETLKQMTIWTRYIDGWSRRDGRWGLEKRIAIRDFDQVQVVTSLAEHDVGRRDRSDPSYTVLGHYRPHNRTPKGRMKMDIAQIADYIAICEVKARYCRALDTKDWAGYADVFTEDLELDTRPAGGALTHGRDESVRMVRAAVETASTSHHVHSPEIKIEGDTAQVVWAMQDRVVWGEDRRAQMANLGHTGFGHYHERYVKKDGRWRIAATKLTRLHMDWHHEKPV